ncbi:TRAP transporter small permease [Halomonas organivorans]|uniref:TRAP transporter small permease protein n=1 Tax=Halomonas organivorans TaxID=257772 RepID=A0A7W5BV64_9GAMM|nr:TRAP transporter small permease [Halomonas organivorans]MBB3139736.1 TRAP-type C4-dicarboxylate transport system permease small subunit [Halomonas organivorans]
MVELFLRVERVTTRVALVVAVLMLIVSVATGFYQVLTRFVFDAPSTWSEVVARSSMIWCVFLAAAPGFRGGHMMSVEVIYKLLPRKGLIVLEAAIALSCVLALTVLVYYGTAMTLRVRPQVLSGLGISIAWVYTAIPLGAGFALMAVVARLLAQLTGREDIGLVDAEAEAAGHDDASSVTESARPAPSTPSDTAGPVGASTRRARS